MNESRGCQQSSASYLFRWTAPYFRGQSKNISFVFGLSMIAIALGLSQPLLTKTIIDEGIVGRDLPVLLYSGAGMLAICLLSPIVGFATRRAYIGASAGILHQMREDLFLQVLQLSQSTLSTLRQGDLMTRLESDLSELQRFALDSALSAINALVLLVGTVVILGLMSPVLTLAVCAVFLANSTILVRLRPRLEMLSKEAREIGVNLSSFLIERTGGIKHIQSFCTQQREVNSLKELHNRVKVKTLELQAVGYFASAIPNLVVSIGIVLLFMVGGWLVLEGRDFTLGVLIAFTTYAQRITGPMQSLSGLYLAWQRARVSLNSIFDLVNLVPRPPAFVQQALPEFNIKVHRGEIVLKDVSFRFDDSSLSIIDRVSLHIRGGSRVLMRAPSGFGKSTLIDLLHRHLSPSSGSIFVGGRNLSSYPVSELRKLMVVVSQDVTIFSGTLEANVTYGCPSASIDEIERAVNAAGLGRLISTNSAGIYAEVGARGELLSGGEKQRVALARAILMKPDILIIDEGTSGLDHDLEDSILQAIDTILKESTRVIVSHKTFIEDNFDQVIDLRLYFGCAIPR